MKLRLLAIRYVLLLIIGTLVLSSCGTAPTSHVSSSPTAGPLSESTNIPEMVASLSEQERRETVIWELNSGPITDLEQWNPLARDARREKGFHQSMIEPLFILNYESGAIEPWLGERMTANATQDVWTLKIRDGVSWSDGEPFHADDVVFTVQLMLDNPELELDFAAGFVNLVESVEKVDDLTVQFNLARPNPRFQLDYFSVKIWGSFAIVPEHIFRDKDPFTFKFYDPEKGWPVFTGPYQIERFDDEGLVYVRDDDWWGAKTGFKPLPQPKRMIWIHTSGDEMSGELVRDHMLDYVGNFSTGPFEELREQNPNVSTWFDGLPYAWMDPCTRLLSLNTMLSPWDSKEMRWAINHAIDRDDIVNRAFRGTTFATRHFFPAYPPLERYVRLIDDAGLYEKYPLMTHDPALSQQIIEQQGWRKNSDGYYEKDGTVLSLTINAHASSMDMQNIAKVISEQLEAIGIRTSMEALPESEWVQEKTLGNFEGMIDWDACGSINEPWAALDRYHERWVEPIGTPVSNYNNQVRWANAEYSAIVDEMAPLSLADPRIDTLFVDAMEIWLDELPMIPLVQGRQLILFDTTYWSGWPTASNSYIHPPAWWQSAHAIIHRLEPTETP